MTRITKTIDLLLSGDPQKINEGMANVSNILPFLLIGGFSQSEIVAYLKAKQVAGEEVLRRLTDIQNNQIHDEDTKLEVGNKKKVDQKEMVATENVSEPSEKEILVPVETNQVSTDETQKQENESNLVDAALLNNQDLQEGKLSMPLEDEVPPQKPGDINQAVIESFEQKNTSASQSDDQQSANTATGEQVTNTESIPPDSINEDKNGAASNN